MKAIFFDFDGTLTYKSPSVWKALWERTGNLVTKDSYYASLYQRFMQNSITHKEWCMLTLYALKCKGCSHDMLMSIAAQTKLIAGAEQTFKALKDNGYSLHIVSGSIKEVITAVLGENAKYFDNIAANRMIFDENGLIKDIEGTNYDFEGKARYIEEYIQKSGAKAGELFFVGNGGNDQWAHRAGCHTICINPRDVDEENNTKWHQVIRNSTNLTDILPLIGIQKQNEEDKEA